MLAVIVDQAKIQQAQAQFSQQLLTALSERIACTVSGVGAGYQDEVAYSAELDLWYSYQAEEKKHWNGFGKAKPVAGKKVSLASEINFPLTGLNRAISGVFAEDENGIYVLHRGKIRGGKEVFFRFFEGEKVQADDAGKVDEFAVIGKLGNPNFAQQVADFVNQVLLVKEKAKNS